jgi:hypothetical protein
VSRKKLPRAENDLFARHPLRIIRALTTGEIDPLGYLVLKFLVDEIEAPGRGGEAIYTLEELGRLIGWSHTVEWLRKKLHALRDAGWIDFDEPRPAPKAAWTFRLGRAAIDGETYEPPTLLQPEPPSELEVTSNRAEDEEAATAQPNSAFEPRKPPTLDFPEQSRAKSEIENRGSEEPEQGDVLGKTTAGETDPAITDRLIALVREDQSELEGEEGALADLQALVDAGVGEWIEDDAQRKL